MLPLCAKKFLGIFAVLALASAPALTPAFAQVENVDPNDAIDADLAAPGYAAPDYATPDYDGNFDASTQDSATVDDSAIDSDINADIVTPYATNDGAAADAVPAPAQDSNTYQDDDLIGAAEGVFGKGAKGLAEVIEDILKKQGRPNAYIAGREASGAFIVGLRYGSGKLYHKIEGERPVYWTGPSIGFDIGGNAANTFVLVYNLYDSEDLYQRFPAGEGAAYFIGGFHVSYLRSGDKVLIPVRLGAGLRLGANVGYMKFSKKQQWLPF